MNIKKKKNNKIYNQGMTYVELIVVLSIFALMASVSMFNYSKFTNNIDIKNLSNDVALRIVQAQKYSANGEIPPGIQQNLIQMNGDIDLWKPSYGIVFHANTQNFFYFVDVNNNKICDNNCPTVGAGEFLELFSINKGNKVSTITTPCGESITDLNLVFVRSDSKAYFNTNPAVSCTLNYVDIGVASANGSTTSVIRVSASGRIEINP